MLRKDREKTPGWLGTGLEDYFNGGWYYQNIMAGPTHGLFVKEPFRTVQYRVHSMDPSAFQESLDMEFERGPDHASRAYFESVSWYYLEQPQAADTMRLRAADRAMPPDPRLDMAVTMTALWSYERLGDWQGERDELAARLRRYTQFPPVARRMLEFRLALLDENWAGRPAAALSETRFPKCAPPRTCWCASGRAGTRSLRFTRTCRPSFSSMGAKSCRPVTRTPCGDCGAFAAGTPCAGDSDAAAVLSRLGATGRFLPRLVCRHDPTWKFACNPVGEWAAMDHDDSAWAQVGGTGVKGPPEEPYIWVEPDPFLGMQSRALGIRPPAWPAGGGFVVYRKVVDVP